MFLITQFLKNNDFPLCSSSVLLSFIYLFTILYLLKSIIIISFLNQTTNHENLNCLDKLNNLHLNLSAV